MKFYSILVIFLTSLLLLSCSPNRQSPYRKQYAANIKAIRPAVLQLVNKHAASTNWMTIENKMTYYTIEAQEVFTCATPTLVIASINDISERDDRIYITAYSYISQIHFRLECSRYLADRILVATLREKTRYNDFAFIIAPAEVSRPIAELTAYVEGEQGEEYAMITTTSAQFTIVTGICVDAMPLNMTVHRSSDVFRLESE